jgi:hypothetical protein
MSTSIMACIPDSSLTPVKHPLLQKTLGAALHGDLHNKSAKPEWTKPEERWFVAPAFGEPGSLIYY